MKQAKGAVKQDNIALNEERLRLALKVADQAWFDVNVQTGEIHVSPEYAGLIGFEPEHFESSLQNWMEHLHPDDRDGVMAAFQSCLASGSPVTMEYRRQTKSGDWAWMRSIGEVVEWDDAKQPVRMIGVHMLISDKKQAEETVEASKHLIDSIVESAPIRIFWKDRDSTYLGCNSLFARDAGLSGPDELIGKSDFDMGWKDQAELYRADDAAVMDSCVPKLGFEEPQTTPDGNTIWLRTSKVPLLDDAGAVVGILGVYEDITEHKQAEQNLKESETRYKNMIDFNPLMCFELDSTGVVKSINREAIEQLGYPAEELIGQPVTIVFPAEMHEAVRTQVDICIRESDRVHKWEITKEHKDGHLLWVSETAITIQSDQQNPTILIMCENIDERKQTELALTTSEAAFRATFNQAAVGIAHVAPDGRWAMVNDRLCDIVGYSRNELMHLTFQDITHPDDLAIDLKHVEQLLAGDIQSYSMEKRYIRKSGENIWINLTASLMRREDGSPDYFISVIEDINERKRFEEALKISREQLGFALQGANDGLWDWNMETNEVYYSPRWKSMLGYGEDDLGNTLEVWKELVDPEQMESILQHVTNYIEGKLPRFESEFRMRHKDGHWVDILARARLAMDESGNELAPRRLIGTHVDISDRKHVERELKHRLDEIERMNKLMIGRELKMEELRQEIKRLKEETG
ncbi:PAS domain S-box protein [Pseudomonadota bacterium]